MNNKRPISVTRWIANKPEYMQAYAEGFRKGWGRHVNPKQDIWKLTFAFGKRIRKSKTTLDMLERGISKKERSNSK